MTDHGGTEAQRGRRGASYAVLAVEGELLRNRAEFTAVGLELPAKISYEDWVGVGSRLARAEGVMQWWLGDWAAFGLTRAEEFENMPAEERRALGEEGLQRRDYGDLREFAEKNHVDYGSLRDMAWVSRAVALSRRRDDLEWSFHREVAALEPKAQVAWLERAAEGHWPRAELRRQIRLANGEGNALEGDGPVVRFIAKSCDDLVHWLKGRPGEFWDDERKRAWKERLRPVVEFWDRL